MQTFILEVKNPGNNITSYYFEEANEALRAAITFAARDDDLALTLTERTDRVIFTFTPPPQQGA